MGACSCIRKGERERVCVCVFLHSVDLKPWQLTHMFRGRLPVQSVQSVDNTLKCCKSPQPKVTPHSLPIPPSWRNTQNKSNELVTIFKLVQAQVKKEAGHFTLIHPYLFHFQSYSSILVAFYVIPRVLLLRKVGLFVGPRFSARLMHSLWSIIGWKHTTVTHFGALFSSTTKSIFIWISQNVVHLILSLNFGVLV
jgi:hypothetical protein